MAVFSFSFNYRLLTIAVIFFLVFIYNVKVSSGFEIQHSPNISDHHGRAENRDSDSRIQAAVIPVVSVNSNSPSNHSRHVKAEVKILMPSSGKSPDPLREGLIRASSIVMDYEEDTRKYLRPGGISNRNTSHHIRHTSHKHDNPVSDDYSAANDAPLMDNDSIPINFDAMELSNVQPEIKIRIPVRALIYARDDASFAPRRIHGNRALKINKNDTWIALHSPVKIFIPVKNNNGDRINSIDISNQCIQCPANMTITAARGQITAEVPVPPISICSHLARRRGRLNVAVITGPRPGTKVKEGDYPVKIIVWKHGGHVYSCEYLLSVSVKKCEDTPFSNGFLPPHWKHFSVNQLSVNCSHENIWGSECKFYCSLNYTLQGQDIVTCEANSEKVAWTSNFPTCKSKKSLKEDASTELLPVHSRLPCAKLNRPNDGTVVCNIADNKNLHPDGTLCQFFCYPGFFIENFFTNDALVICKNGLWTPTDNITCLASFCSEPKLPHHGSFRCEGNIKDSTLQSLPFKSTYRNGTTCSFYCDSGYTIPESQKYLQKMICQAPSWKSSSSPECKRIEAPQPHPKDCKNLTLIVNQRGVAKLRPPKFLLSEESSASKTYILGNCTYKGKLRIGTYINNCSAHDEELNVTGYCTYSVIVKENTCSVPPPVSNSHLECNNINKTLYPKKTICKYICSDGYVIPKKQMKFKSRFCTSKLEWKPFAVPSCIKAVPPKPRKNSCLSQVLFLRANKTSVKLKLPKFRSSLKGSKVKVNCTLRGYLTVGNYTNVCEAVDTQLTLTSSCSYNILVKERECDVLPIASKSFIDCTFPDDRPLYSSGTVCSYKCHEGFVIPTSLLRYSTKLCSNEGLWNNTIIPDCVPEMAPVPADNSCLDNSVDVDDLESFVIPLPQFKSFSGAELNITCQPTSIETYSSYLINCSAYDPQLRSTGVCSFLLNVYNSNQVAQFQQAERGCSSLGPVKNGNLNCNYSHSNVFPIQTLCEIVCNKDYIVPRKEIEFSFAICTAEGIWNVSQIPDCVKAQPPKLISGCTSDTLKTTNPVDLKVPLPYFVTVRNTSADVSCSSEVFESYKTYDVECTAKDNELETTVSCSFYITIEEDESVKQLMKFTTSFEENVTNSVETFTTSFAESVTTSTVSTFTTSIVNNFTTTMMEESTFYATEVFTSTTTKEQFNDCEQLQPPPNGIINCTEETSIETCAISCESGFAFPSTYANLQDGLIECDGIDGLWDFQRSMNTSTLPECLALLSNTTAIVSISFNASVEKCDVNDEMSYQQTIKNILLPLNDDVCDMIDCEALIVRCYLVGSRIILNVNWTLQSAYDPSKYEVPGIKEVPDFETHFESVLDVTKMTVQENWFKEKLLDFGIQLNQTSFSKSYIELACGEDGYGIDEKNNKCIACPSGTMEKNNKCVPCPIGYYQLQSGQTSCDACPSDAKSIGDFSSVCLSN